MTTAQLFPALNIEPIVDTRDALHAYAGILGGWLKSCRPRRKHWWHASLRPSLTGLATGVVHAGVSFELELNLQQGLLYGRTSDGAQLAETLHGQSAHELAKKIEEFLITNRVDAQFAPEIGGHGENGFADYTAEHARNLARVLNSVNWVMSEFRAGIAEETSPIQLWPHHFDLSMLWLPGEKIAGQDPKDEEYSDKQMNFGFTFGDEGISEPYFYVTAYPSPGGFASLRLPVGTRWQTDGFNGAVIPYRSLLESNDPNRYLLDLWSGLLSAAREQMLANAE